MTRRTRLLAYAAGVLALVTVLVWRLVASTPPDDEMEWLLQRGRMLWGIAGLAVLVAVFRKLDEVLAIPLSAESRIVGLALVTPALLADVESTGACATIIGLGFVALAIRLGRRVSRVGLEGILLSFGTLAAPPGLLFVPWLLLRRRWRLVVAWLIALFVIGVMWELISMLPGRFATIGDLLANSLGAWGDPLLESRGDQSLRRLLHLALRSEPSDPTWLAESLYGTLAVSGLVVGLLVTRRRFPAFSNALPGVEIANALALAVALSPRATSGLFVLIWPVAALSLDAFRQSCSERFRRAGAWVLAGAGLAFLVALLSRYGALPLFVLDAAPMTLGTLALVALVAHPAAHPQVRVNAPKS